MTRAEEPAADFVVLAAHEEGSARWEMREYADQYVALYMKIATAGGWYVKDSIAVPK